VSAVCSTKKKSRSFLFGTKKLFWDKKEEKKSREKPEKG
jgi:hypothetical protein